jgi:hypothetical protein
MVDRWHNIEHTKKVKVGEQVAYTHHLGRSQPITDLSCFGISQRRTTRVQHSNLRSCKLRGVLELGPSQWSLVEVLARKEPYLYCISGIRGLESRVFDFNRLMRL